MLVTVAGSVEPSIAGPPEPVLTQDQREELAQQVLELMFQYMQVPLMKCVKLRMVVMFATGSCLYSIAMAHLTEDEFYEWNCVSQYANGVAKEPQREAEVKRLAQGVANRYKDTIEAEHMQEPPEYEAIVKSLDIALDVHMIYGVKIMYFCINGDSASVVEVLWSGLGEEV